MQVLHMLTAVSSATTPSPIILYNILPSEVAFCPNNDRISHIVPNNSIMTKDQQAFNKNMIFDFIFCRETAVYAELALTTVFSLIEIIITVLSLVFCLKFVAAVFLQIIFEVIKLRILMNVYCTSLNSCIFLAVVH